MDNDRPPFMAGTYGRQVRIALTFVLLLRLIHLWFALRSPLTFQMGPDEDYYYRFGMDVAHGQFGLTSEFGFMDPLYGYLLGAILKFAGNLFPVYLIQSLVDTSTAWALALVGRDLGRPGTGILAAVIYGLLGPALAFSTMLLKTTWVTAYLAWWVLLALRVMAKGSRAHWFWFGIYCGIGVALRANLLLMAVFGICLLALQSRQRPARDLVMQSGTLLLGLAMPLMLLTARNVAVADRWSPVPTNGGIVLHQLYNPGNPQSFSGQASFPPFVHYRHPSEVWAGYKAEAERIAGHALGDDAVTAYWGGQARGYLFSHPLQSVRNSIRKLTEFAAYPEVPNNRSYGDEQLFSPLLAWLPQPFGWLLALGLPGMILLARQDRRGRWLFAPVAMGLTTIGIFFAEDRFRFNIVAPFVFGSAVWLHWLWSRRHENTVLLAGLCVSGALGAFSTRQGSSFTPPPMDWERIANGYILMGEPSKARQLLDEMALQNPRAPGLNALQGLLALRSGDEASSLKYLQAALAERQDRHEIWHNYSLALEHHGEVELALAAEARAQSLSPLPVYGLRMGMLLERLARPQEAGREYRRVLADPRAHVPPGTWAIQARERLRVIGQSTGH